MLSDAIGDVLPAAMAVALSPIPIVAVTLILGSSHAQTSGPAFTAGWVTGLATIGALVLFLFSGAGAGADDGEVAWVKLVLGLLFLALAVKTWQQRPTGDEQAEMPAWMAKLDDVKAPTAAKLGVALSGANPKNVALTLAASATIADAGLNPSDEAIAIAVFVAVGSVTVAGAVIAYLVLGERAARPLTAVRQFMAKNNTAIMMVVLLLLGVNFLGDALGGL